ncbi:MAG: undecaprenyl-diphosphate phosphatase [Oscillospiraceae bacterium]|nr:undecaprenyl-diphosphate phosphatase [Oscillospiraceae bacterium]
MTLWNAVLLGLVQGIAEILPISGSGHLSIINNLFKLSDVSEGHMLFGALLRLATLISVVIVYWPELCAMAYELLSFANLGPYAGQERQHYVAARVFFMLVMGSIPLFFLLPVHERIDALSSRNILVGVMLILTGCLLAVSDRMTPGKKTAGTMTVTDALLIGLCQAVSAIPGLSRTAVSVTAGVATGLKPSYAVHFSLLLSIPAVFGSCVLSFGQAFEQGIDWHSVPAYLIGMAVAILSSIFSIRILRMIGKRGKFGGFSYYCWVVGVLSIILYLIF